MNAMDPKCLSRCGKPVFGLLVWVAGLPACSQNKAILQPTAGDWAWPPPPAQARVRYLGEISGPLPGSKSHSRFEAFLFGPGPKTHMITPHAVAVDRSGMRVAVTDANAHCVHVFNLRTNTYERVDSATTTPLQAPIGVAFGDGLLFVSDPPRASIEAFGIDEPSITHVRSLASHEFARPTGLAYDYRRDVLYVCDSAAHHIVSLHADGRVVGKIGRPGSAEGELRFPAHVACASDGTIAVSDSMNFRVQRFSGEDGAFYNAFGKKGDAQGDFALPKGIASDAEGNLWVVDAHFENVQAFSLEGELLMVLGREGHKPGQFWLPAGAFIDGQNRMWIADTYNRRVQVFQLLP